MRVLLTSHGSTGDIYPVIRLGRALVEAGHHVRFATTSFFREEVESAGIEYVYLPPDWDQAEFSRAMRDLTRAWNPLHLMRIIYSESLPYLDEILDILEHELQRTDVFVSSYLFANLCVLARKHKVPCAVTTFVHNVVPSSSYPPENLPRLRIAPVKLRRRWNRMLWRLTDRVLCWNIASMVGRKLAQRGLPGPQSFVIEPADKVIVTVSPELFMPTPLWSDRFEFAGYLRWQSPEQPAMEAELRDFCGDDKVPILSFGSVTFDDTRQVMSRFLRHWPKGKKIIIQSGWAELAIEEPRAEIRCVGRVSHDQLFRYASMVIHHGGAGTTASVLHAGVPHIIIPHIGDQWFSASEIKRLGCGLEVKRKHWPERLPNAVHTVEQDPKMYAQARANAQLLTKEDGPANAVKILETLVGNK
jgi:UDP:flavonoid glycosyltransferase YjiC (YdhE family)